MPRLRRALAAAGWLACSLTAVTAAPAATVHRNGASYAVDVWETDDGLPQNSVIALTQTRDGYLWLGTLNGLVRFDGLKFTVFNERNTPGLTSSQIVSLFEDSRLNLWIGTERAGVHLAHQDRVVGLDLGRGSREGRLVAACEDATGAVWLYTADGQLARHHDGRVDVWAWGAERSSRCRTVTLESPHSLLLGIDWALDGVDPAAVRSQSELPATRVASVGKLDFLLASRAGGHWRLAEGRLGRWETGRLVQDLGSYPWGTTPVSAACEDNTGRLVVGTLGAGVYHFHPDGSFTRFSTEEGLSHNFVLSLTVDREGSLWVGTDGGGLNRIRQQGFEVLAASRGRVAQSVCGDARGGVWVGYNGGGLDHWRQDQLESYGAAQGLMNVSIRAVLVDRAGEVWVGTWGAGVLRLRNGRFESVGTAGAIHPVVLALYQDRAGRIWAGTQAGLARWDDPNWRVFRQFSGLSSEVIQALAEDSQGTLWIGTAGGGLHQMRNGQIAPWVPQEGAAAREISSLLVDAQDVVWVGTAGSGLLRVQGGQITSYTTAHGLVSDSLGYLLEDGTGHLWIGSNAGLMRVPKAALQELAQGRITVVPCRVFGQTDGLPTRECTLGSQPGAWQSPQGTLWFPTIKGLAAADPARLKPNLTPPPVIIESVIVEGQVLARQRLRTEPPRSLTLPATRERLEIHYTGLNLSAPDRARFRYRLEGHETAWTEAGDVRVARYSRLPPGDYRFQVTACNEDGIWNETGSTLGLILQPPFWRTAWFMATASLALLGSIVAAVHYVSTQRLQRQVERLHHQQQLERDRARIARDLHDQLGASLTQVALLGEMAESDKDSPAEVESHARQIAQTARDITRVLDEIVWAVNPSNDTLDSLVTYFCKYAQEYLTLAGLRYRQEVPAQLPATPVAPEVRHNVFLAAKEAVTNVVRHAHARAAHVRLRLGPTAFTLEIEDDGRGFPPGEDPDRARRNGLRNMSKRLEEIGGAFSIGPADGGGTIVRLTAPLPPT